MDSNTPPTWTITEVSETTGLSVRVLRHWEQRGLLVSTRTGNGHRRYGPEQITRLYRAIALRRTGLGLGPIAALLTRDGLDPGATFRTLLDEINTDLRRHTQLRDRLTVALADIDDSEAAASADPTLLMRVIETMTMFEQYVHGYHRDETSRLHDQAGTLVDLLHDGVVFPPGSSVLEAGCGVGAQTVTLARRNPGAVITSIDLSADSLAEAKRRSVAAGLENVHFVIADIYDLPDVDLATDFEPFDHVFVCFVLEHLPRPVEALERLKLMLKPSGRLTVIEGDHGSTYFHPDSAAAREVIACQVTLQQLAGGDALIGRQLYPLLRQAGYHDVHVEPRPVYVDASRPELVQGFTSKTFIAMVASVREPAIAAGLIEPERFDAGIRDLQRTTQHDGVFCYTFLRATATAGK